ncbi:hypothetical protein NQ317_009034 [Molorchus minor]|uniref:glucose-6-phosphate 1-epimerase n=1 Tax=Molorchus minor TaxID=1323400 RepID=A0ABQ9IVH9_9CUCU|nr:hypothetical protein NQ317_009034 [Molorchus minor]
MLYENETVFLNRDDYTTCTINLHGATVTSWRFEDEEQLYVGRRACLSGLNHLRGGISFVFPKFDEWFFGPPHGFARNMPWKLDEGPVVMDSRDVYAQFSVSNDDFTESMWNFKFKITYKIILLEKRLSLEISIDNVSEYFPFEFCFLHHSLFKVPDVTKCEVTGFKDHFYKDELKKTNEYFLEDRDIVTISKWTDDIYIDVVEKVVVAHVMNDLKLEIGPGISENVNLWNPYDKCPQVFSPRFTNNSRLKLPMGTLPLEFHSLE